MRFLALIFMLITSSLFATQSLENISKTVLKDDIIIAKFTQEKTISGLAKPLKSTGELILWGDKGVLWTVHTPFPSTLFLSKNGIFQVEGTQKTKLITGNQQNNLMLNILPKILSGNFSAITEFDVKLLSPAGATKWKVQLIPGASIAKVIDSLTIAGETFINQITIQRANGDKDVISLHNQSVKKKIPTHLEAIFNE